MLAIAEMIRSGTTCFNRYVFLLTATAEVADLRRHPRKHRMTIIDFPTAWAKDTAEYFSKGIEFTTNTKTTTASPQPLHHAIYTVAEHPTQSQRSR